MLEAYRRTSYEADGAVARVGEHTLSIDRLLARHGVRSAGFVSAFNPMSRRRPHGWNRRMHAALLAWSRGFPSVAGRGVARRGCWFEEHLLIAADPRRLAVLGRRFNQRAIVVVARGRRARLLLLK